MKGNLVLNCLVITLLFISSIPLVSQGEESRIDHVSEEFVTDIENDLEEANIPASLDINDLIEQGIGFHRTVDLDDSGDITSSFLGDLSWLYNRANIAPIASPMAEESDSMDNPFYIYDGDTISNNVTSTISGTQITFDDEDFFQINLTSDGINSTVDRLEMVITSTDAEEKNASLTIEALQPNFVLQQFMDTGFESVGKYHGNTTSFVFVPEGDPQLNFEVPYIFRFRSWNSTMLNYSFTVDVTQTTRTEWNGIMGGGPVYNTTNKPPNMQSINRSHDFIDWFDLSGSISEKGLDTERGDQIRFGVSIDIATEERGKMFNPYGLYGVESPTTSLMFVFLVWLNYSAQQLNIYNIQGNLPYASMLFGNDPLTLNFQSMANRVWLGMSPLSLWGYSGQYSVGAEGNAEVFFNISQIVTSLIPPNSAPVLSDPIPDQEFYEDEGPWNVTDLLDHFYDEEHATITDGSIPPLEFIISKPMGVSNPDELKLSIKEGRYLWAEVTTPNWYGEGQFKIKCKDWGVADSTISIDDREAESNIFTIEVLSVNDDAYIEKVETTTGYAFNNHEIIDIFLSQNSNMYRSKKVFGRDNDTEDQNRLIYTHNATTPSFKMNDNGQIDFIPTNDDVGETYIRIWVDDGKGDDRDDYVDLRFIVSNINDKPSLLEISWPDGARSYDVSGPEISPTFKNVREDFEINLTVTASDPDIEIGMPDTLTWVVGANGWKAYNHPTDPLKAYITYTPTNDDAIRTMAETTLICMDISNAMSQEITIRLMVDNVNDPPRILSVSNEVPTVQGKLKKVSLTQSNDKHGLEDELYSIAITAEDIDPRDSVTFKSSDPAFQFFPDPLDPFSGNFTILPTQEMVGMHTVIFTVTDEDGDTDSVTVDFEIVNTNDPPMDFKVDWETAIDFVVGNNITFFVENLEDPDGDELTVIWDFGDNSGTQEGEIVQHSFANDQSYIITVKVRDPFGAEKEKTRTITIYPAPEEEIPEDLDSDGDGIPDIWEDENGLDKYRNDSMLDNDGDGFTNLEEYLHGTNPLDPKSHPPRDETEDEGMDTILLLAIIIVILFVLIAAAFLIFALTRKPKPAMQQQAYGVQPGLPGPGHPGDGPRQQLNEEAGSQNLPPAEIEDQKEEEKEPEPEEELPDSFLMDATEQIRQESEPLPGEENIWRPPVEESEPEQESQIDDLFADGPREDETSDEQEPPDEEGDGPPAPPKMPSMPPPPPEP